jgi:hypothetical protein
LCLLSLRPNPDSRLRPDIVSKSPLMTHMN